MPYTLAEAAIAAGRDRSTLLRAIKSGKLSATRDPATDAWRVEAAELARVYGLVGTDIGGTQAKSELHIGDASADVHLQLAVERTKTAGLEARLADMEQVNKDLRRRLDTATAQLGEALQQVRLLTDQRIAPPAPARRSWWRWRRVP